MKTALAGMGLFPRDEDASIILDHGGGRMKSVLPATKPVTGFDADFQLPGHSERGEDNGANLATDGDAPSAAMGQELMRVPPEILRRRRARTGN